MKVIAASEVQPNFLHFLDEVAGEAQPILILGKRANAVLVSEDVWRGMEETLYLVSIPGMRESILDGGDTPIGECSDEPW
jgi:antitoxin YefM